MEIFLLVLISFGASWLTFFCGFGLGTLLTPVFYLLFNDLIFAISATAIVHFLNNVFKFLLMKRSIDWKIVLPFGLAAIPAALLGAYLLSKIQNEVLVVYNLGHYQFEITLLNLLFGTLLLIFALLELVPRWNFEFSKGNLWIGGIVSGLIGGISGHQGAVRSAFLVRYNLPKEVFIATGIVIALIIDIVRMSVYAKTIDVASLEASWMLILLSLLGALGGAVTGKFFLKKMNIDALNKIVGFSMLIFGISLIFGFLV
jgi:uncharacterized membrane protein YfcA